MDKMSNQLLIDYRTELGLNYEPWKNENDFLKVLIDSHRNLRNEIRKSLAERKLEIQKGVDYYVEHYVNDKFIKKEELLSMTLQELCNKIHEY